MQFTVDTRNATAFELNALAEFVQKLASVAPLQPGRVLAGPEALPMPFEGADRTVRYWHHPESSSLFTTVGDPSGQVDESCCEIEAAQYEELKAKYAGNAPAQPASGAPDLPQAAGPAPEVPPVPGDTPPAVAAAPESTNPPAVPAVPTSVPAAPASTSAAAPADGQVELDSAGCPWSPLIHTSNKATIGDGTWRKKPGVNPEYFESVRAELMAGNAPAAASTTPPAVPAAPATEQACPAPEAPNLLTGNDVMARAMEIQMADGTKSAALFQAIQGAGIPAGPMGLPGCTDQAVLAAALAAVNAVGAQ